MPRGKKAHWKIKLRGIYQRERNYRNSIETECELYEDFKQLKSRKENGRTRFVVAVQKNNPHILTLKYPHISVRNMPNLLQA